MPYRDKVRARETAKARMRRFRERQKKGVTGESQGVTVVTPFFDPLPAREMPPDLAKSNAKFERWK